MGGETSAPDVSGVTSPAVERVLVEFDDYRDLQDAKTRLELAILQADLSLSVAERRRWQAAHTAAMRLNTTRPPLEGSLGEQLVEVAREVEAYLRGDEPAGSES